MRASAECVPPTASSPPRTAGEAPAGADLRLATLLDSLDALVYVADLDTYELLYVNRYGREHWGDVVGRICWQALQAGQEGPCSFCTNARLVDPAGRPTGVHTREVRNTVTRRWYECRDQAIVWDDGRLVRLEIATDITARKEAEEAQRLGAQEVRSILAAVPTGIIIVDAETHRIREVNDAAAVMIGLAKDMILGRLCHEFICPRQAGNCPITDQGQTVDNAERVLLAAGGESLPVLKTAVPVSLEGRQCVLESFVDIRRQKETERLLEENNTFLHNVLESLTHPFCVIDAADHTVCMANSAAGPTFGIGMKCYQLTHHQHSPCDSQDHPCPLDMVKATGEPTVVEHVHYDRANHPRNVEVHAYPVFGEDGQVEQVIEYALDITERREFEKKRDLDISVAKRIMGQINGTSPRTIPLGDARALFVEARSMPHHAAGGDHYFIRTIPAATDGAGARTFVSLKDQSGHEVNCVLRSIVTDLMHNAILHRDGDASLADSLERLNNGLCGSGVFLDDAFVTTVTVAIDHESCTMDYASCGHPALLLIRDGNVLPLPGRNGPGHNLPMGAIEGATFSTGRCDLQPGDKMILYTDGLTEAPLTPPSERNSAGYVRRIVRELLAEGPSMGVSRLVRRLFEVATRGGRPGDAPEKSLSLSDDVTVLGLEIEDCTTGAEACVRPRDEADLDRTVLDLTDRIVGDWRAKSERDLTAAVRTVLEEALRNAWIHAHRRQADRPIRVRWRSQNDLHLDVRDQGPGFRPGDVPDPTAPENRTRPSGRGLFVVRHMSDYCRWEDGGRRLVASFLRQITPEIRDRLARVRRRIELW